MIEPYPGQGWLTAAQVMRWLGLSKTGLKNLRESDPTFPKPREWPTGGRRFDKFLLMVWAESQRVAEEAEEEPPAPRPARRPRNPPTG